MARDQVVAIGNFDGVHLGHQSLLSMAGERAKSLGLDLVLLTFNPHPSRYFRPDLAFEALFSETEKLSACREYGVKDVVAIPFNRELALKTPESFFNEILKDSLHARVIVVGEDFRFGSGRTGSFLTLQELGHKHGCEVIGVTPVSWAGESVSSTRIRHALKSGDVEGARKMLHKTGFCYTEIVEHGRRLGRTLGFPTLNMKPENKLLLPLGVYVTESFRPDQDQHPFPSISNVGVRPTVHSQSGVVVETHVLKWNAGVMAALSQASISVRFLKKIRNEQKFPDLETLKAQISQDVAQARVYHSIA